MSGEEGSLGDIRKVLAGITRRLDALAEAVGVAGGPAAPGALLDEPTRARLVGLESLLAIGREATRAETCLLAIDRALTHARADCAAILWRAEDGALTVLAQRGFRVPPDSDLESGIVGRALRSAEVVQTGPGLGPPDDLLAHHGLGAAVVVPAPAAAGPSPGALLVGRRRPVPIDVEAVGSLVIIAHRLADALRTPPDGAVEEADPSTLFATLDLGRTGHTVATEAAARLGAEVAAVLLPTDAGFVPAGAVGLPDEARALGPVPTLDVVAATRWPWIPTSDAESEAALTRWLGRPARAVLPLALDEGVVALLAVGGTKACGTALPPSFARPAALALRNARLYAESRRPAADAAAPAVPDVHAAPLGDMASLLAVVVGRLAAVRDRVGDAEAAQDLAHAEEAAWRVAEGLRRVLGFAPRSGGPVPAPLDLGAAVHDAVRATERLWATEGVAPPVTLDLEPVPLVRVDPEDLQQAIHHLLANAREAGDGPQRVAVKLRWDGAAHVELTIADDGRGMDEATRARAGEPFFTTKGPGRLGVGLAVVQAVVARHRGHLDVESGAGRGTTVRLRLPTVSGAAPGAPFPKPPAPGPRRILVVDDDHAVRETLVQGLARDGYLVDVSGDVGEATARLGRGPVDLVVTDLVMPSGSGLEIARTVKRLHPSTPVVLITGWPGRVDSHTLESHGIDAVVEKPVGLDTLRATVATLIERAPTRPR